MPGPHLTSAHGRTTASVALLDVEPDLAADLPGPERAVAHRLAMLPAVHLSPGGWSARDLSGGADVQGTIHGFLVITGLVAMRMTIGGRGCVRPVFPSELVLLDGEPSGTLPVQWEWEALETSHVALLDRRLWAIADRGPQIGGALMRRAGLHARRVQLHQTISQLPRVEDRLLALLWTIADQRGTVGPDGVAIRVSLTHETLAQMIGARRSTVSLGLTALEELGRVTRTADGFRLDPESAATF